MQKKYYGSLLVSIFLLFGSSCEKKAEKPQGNLAVPVVILEVQTVNAPLVFDFVGQAESSRQVEIRARVDGFLDDVVYDEGEMVQAGQVLFILDKKPYTAALQQAEGELARQQARLFTSSANLKRIQPLAEKDAVSQKDLDDAIGAKQGAEATVLSAEGQVREAELNLGYATIYSPLKGLASKTDKQVGSYIPTGPDSLLTYVARVDPIWVNFSVSENQILEMRTRIKKGRMIPPKDKNYEVVVVLGDGMAHPYTGTISFAEPNLDPTTGTFLIRAVIPNPKDTMRPGQFVRVKLHGAIRPNAILIPQSAVIQGAKGHFVWVLDKKNQAQVRHVEVGSWQGDQWFIENGLNVGDRVVIDGIVRLNEGREVKIVPAKERKT